MRVQTSTAATGGRVRARRTAAGRGRRMAVKAAAGGGGGGAVEPAIIIGGGRIGQALVDMGYVEGFGAE